MKIPERFFLRHQILKLLCERLPEVDKLQKRVFDISFLDVKCATISERLNISNQRIRELSSLMVKEEEVEFDHTGDFEILRIKHNGIIAYIDRKYILGGRDYVLDSIGKYFGIISGIILLIIAVVTFIINILETRENHNDIKILDKKVQQLELKKN